MFKAAKAAHKAWAKTPLWKRAEYLHKVAALMKENAKASAAQHQALDSRQGLVASCQGPDSSHQPLTVGTASCMLSVDT